MQYVDNPLTATCRNKVYAVGVPGQNKGKTTGQVHGTVTEAETSEPMYGALVFDDNTQTCTRTDHGVPTFQLTYSDALGRKSDRTESRSIRCFLSMWNSPPDTLNKRF